MARGGEHCLLSKETGFGLQQAAQAARNTSPKGSGAPFWPLQLPALTGTQIPTEKHTHKNKTTL